MRFQVPKEVLSSDVTENPLDKISKPYATCSRSKAGRPLEPYLTLKMYSVQMSHSDHSIKKTIIKAKDPDAIILAPYFFNFDGTSQLVMCGRINPLSGKYEIYLPKRYISEKRQEDSIATGIDNLLKKVNLTPTSYPVMTSSSFITLPGTTPFVDFPFQCEVSVIERPFSMANDFYGTIDIFSVSSIEIIENLLRGNFQDPYALRAAFNLEPDPHSLIPPDIRKAVFDSNEQFLKSSKWVTSRQLCDYIWEQAPPNISVPLNAKILKNKSGSPLVITDNKFECYDESSQLIHQCSYESISSSTGLNHQVIILGYAKVKDETGQDSFVCLINIGSRSFTTRQLSNHKIQSEKSDFNIEPHWCYSEEKPSDESVREAAYTLTGMSAISDPLYIGSYNPNPEFAHIKADCYLVEVDVSNLKSDNGNGLFQCFVPLKDIQTGILDGTIRSTPIAVMSDVLAHAANISRDHKNPFTSAEEEKKYYKMIKEGSEYRRVLEKAFAKQFSILKKSGTFTKILEGAYNFGFGLKKNGEEFYSCLPEYGLLKSLSPLKRFMLLLHDLYHGAQGDLIPWDFSVSPTKLISFDEYLKGVLTNEGQAVYFSDVFLANRYGHENWRKHAKSMSLGEALTLCGIINKEDQRKTTVSMVRDGLIDSRLKDSPRYEACKEPIEYFRGYYDRDTQNAREAYEYWKNHPEVARAVLCFNERCTSKPRNHIARVTETISSIRKERNRGINPLRHELHKLKDLTLLKLAIQCSFVADETENEALKKTLLKLKTKLEKIHQFLGGFDRLIHGTHPSEQNVKVFRHILKSQQRVQRYEQYFREILESSGYDANSIHTLFSSIPLWAAPFELPKENIST